MSKSGFGIAGFITWLAAAGCAGKATHEDRPGGDAGGGHPSSSSAGVADNAGGPNLAGAGGAVAGAGSGGTPAAGGHVGRGGEASLGGSAGASVACGGPTALRCPIGQLCDIESKCGKLPNLMGVCTPIPKVDECTEQEDPEGSSCGCDGKDYANSCWRRAFGVPRASIGYCPSGGVASYPTAYGVWLAPRGDGGVGPAVEVTAAGGTLRTWDALNAFLPDHPPPNPNSTKTLSLDDSDGLFLRLAGVPLDSLPHDATSVSTCHPTFYFRICETCAIRALIYSEPAQVMPEMEPVWAWFDRVLGASAPSNPRNFCKSQSQ
jgi:hypothetical protein